MSDVRLSVEGRGSRGPEGRTGPTGPTGPGDGGGTTGPTGPSGPSGGPTGSTGSTGATGATVTGPTGPSGPQDATRQTFRYTASGSEDPAGFPITLPTARADANYNAIVTCGVVADILAFSVSAQTTTEITVVPSGQPTAGDVYFVICEELT